MARNDMIEVEDLEFLHETDSAILVEYDGEEVWLPLSQIEWDGDAEKGDSITVTMPEWLAEEKGLI